jgi:hypothetical protein
MCYDNINILIKMGIQDSAKYGVFASLCTFTTVFQKLFEVTAATYGCQVATPLKKTFDLARYLRRNRYRRITIYMYRFDFA